MWSSVRGGLRGAGEPAQRLPRPPLRHQGGQHRASDPQAQDGELLPRWLLERRQRAETALTTVVATCYLLGVSTRRLERLAEALGITTLSKSQVSEMAKELDGLVESFRTRPLDQGPYRFVWADALVVKVREGGSIVGVHVLIATGVNAEGRREILGCEVTSAEDGAGWLAFFRSLVARGLHGVQLVTSDAHPASSQRSGRPSLGPPGSGAGPSTCGSCSPRSPSPPSPGWPPWSGPSSTSPTPPKSKPSSTGWWRPSERSCRWRQHILKRRERTCSPSRASPWRSGVRSGAPTPPGTAPPRDPTQDRRGRDLSRPQLHRSPHRRRAHGTDRRVDRVAPLHGN
jgi:hypothetical protein